MSAATSLTPLRTRLRQLQGRRRGDRFLSATAVWLLAVAGLIAGLFLFDWLFQPPLSLRGLLLIGFAAGVGWSFWRWAWPLIAVRESEAELALQVERAHQIDSDLVAALQFNESPANAWGSRQLRTAVVEYVAEFSATLDVFAGYSSQATWRRMGFALLTWCLLVGVGFCFPEYLGSFWNRFLLGSARYPTGTMITQITLNDQPILGDKSAGPILVRVPYGIPIRISVTAAGKLPATGTLQLTGLEHHAESQVELTTATDASGQFRGEIARLGESVRCRVTLGDTWSDPWEIQLVPLPVVELELPVTPPDYAAGQLPPDSANSLRLLSVLEGSTIQPRLTCVNKSLKSVWMTIDNQRFEFVKSVDKKQSVNPGGEVWTVAAAPFAPVRAVHQFELQVKDTDGLMLPAPLTGTVRLKTDRVPRVVAAIVSRHVLPTASPKITYGAVDDFGIARLRLTIQIIRESAPPQQHERDLPKLAKPEAVVRGEYALPLSEFPLEKGDEVRLTLTAWDHRGTLESQAGSSEPLVLQVTDRNGILAGLLETDQQSAKQLDSIIQRELGIGGEK